MKHLFITEEKLGLERPLYHLTGTQLGPTIATKFNNEF